MTTIAQEVIDNLETFEDEIDTDLYWAAVPEKPMCPRCYGAGYYREDGWPVHCPCGAYCPPSCPACAMQLMEQAEMEASQTVTTIDLAAISDEWEELVSTGIELAQHMDTGRWALGDLAGRVEKRYGTDAIGNFAGEIGMARKATLKQYRQVSARYESATRVAFPTLTWTHFRDAMRAKDDAELWLAQAADQNWPSVEMARQIAAAIGKPVPPKLLYSGRGYVIEDTIRYLVSLSGPVECELADGLIVTVKVYEQEAA